jgi:hypothetical protein
MTRSQVSDLLTIYYSIASLLAMQPLLRDRAVDLLAARPANWQDRSLDLRTDWETWEGYMDDELRRLGAWLDEVGDALGLPSLERPAAPDWGCA